MFISIVVLFVSVGNYLYGYIDPGTGSLLFSALLGILTTGFFVLKALIIRFKSFSFSASKAAKNSKKSRLVIYGEDKRYWVVFKPIADELIAKGFYFIYYTSDKNDPALEYKNEYMHAEFIGEGNKGYTRLSMIDADICLMTTPNLDVFQLKRSKGVKYYAHIVHAPSETSLYCIYGLDFFDGVFINGEHQKEDIINLENLRNTKKKDISVVGSTYLDELSKKKQELNIDMEKNTILIAPSWGDNAILKKFGTKLLDALSKSKFNIIIRPHPQSFISEPETLNALKDRYKHRKNITWDDNRENIVSLSKASIMISDFSGVIFDYAFLFEKPCLITKFDFDKRSYDASDLNYETWTFKTLKEISIPLEECDFANIEKKINEVSNNKTIIENIVKIKKEAYQYQGEAGKITAQKIINLLIDMETN